MNDLLKPEIQAYLDRLNDYAAGFSDGRNVTTCVGNSGERSECFLHDKPCRHRGCKTDNRCEHDEVKGFCMECAYPSTRSLQKQVDGLEEELAYVVNQLLRTVRALETISSIAGDMLNEERRVGPGMSNMRAAQAAGGCVSDVAEEEEESK